jgi:hypothetical protein
MCAVIGDSGNAASIGLHAAWALKTRASFPDMGHKFGRWVDLVWMQRSLNGGGQTRPTPPDLSLAASETINPTTRLNQSPLVCSAMDSRGQVTAAKTERSSARQGCADAGLCADRARLPDRGRDLLYLISLSHPFYEKGSALVVLEGLSVVAGLYGLGAWLHLGKARSWAGPWRPGPGHERPLPDQCAGLSDACISSRRSWSISC